MSHVVPEGLYLQLQEFTFMNSRIHYLWNRQQFWPDVLPGAIQDSHGWWCGISWVSGDRCFVAAVEHPSSWF